MTPTDSFSFTPENDAKAKAILKRYPEGRQASAILPLLTLAQAQHGGWLPQPALDYLADYLAMPRIRVYEVASFYDMFNTRPVGRIQIRVCRTTPCWLCGSNDIFATIKEETGAEPGETSADGLFTVMEVECLGACVNAPVVQVNDDYFEDLNKDNVKVVLRKLKAGEWPKPGSQSGRHSTEPAGGALTLKSIQS